MATKQTKNTSNNTNSEITIFPPEAYNKFANILTEESQKTNTPNNNQPNKHVKDFTWRDINNQ